MKKQDLIILAFLPTVLGIVLLVVSAYLEPVWIVLQVAAAVLLAVIWWLLGRWCAGQDKNLWNGFALLQWWGVVNFVFSLISSVSVLQSLAQMYASCMGFLLLPVLGIVPSVVQLPLMVLITLALTMAAYVVGFTGVSNKRGRL